MVVGILIAGGILALVTILWTACAGAKLRPTLGEHDGIRVFHSDELGHGYHFKHNGTGWAQWGYRSSQAALAAARAQRAAFDQATIEQLERHFE
jgi:hypothetical protein